MNCFKFVHHFLDKLISKKRLDPGVLL